MRTKWNFKINGDIKNVFFVACLVDVLKLTDECEIFTFCSSLDIFNFVAFIMLMQNIKIRNCISFDKFFKKNCMIYAIQNTIVFQLQYINPKI